MTTKTTNPTDSLKSILAICADGVIERRETGKPTWSALDAIAELAKSALENLDKPAAAEEG